MGIIKKLPQRKCVGCQNVFPKKELLRIVKNEEGIFLDPTGKQNGRGAYICKNAGCLETAYKRKNLERSFKCKVEEQVYQSLRQELSDLKDEISQ